MSLCCSYSFLCGGLVSSAERILSDIYPSQDTDKFDPYFEPDVDKISRLADFISQYPSQVDCVCSTLEINMIQFLKLGESGSIKAGLAGFREIIERMQVLARDYLVQAYLSRTILLIFELGKETSLLEATKVFYEFFHAYEDIVTFIPVSLKLCSENMNESSEQLVSGLILMTKIIESFHCRRGILDTWLSSIVHAVLTNVRSPNPFSSIEITHIQEFEDLYRSDRAPSYYAWQALTALVVFTSPMSIVQVLTSCAKFWCSPAVLSDEGMWLEILNHIRSVGLTVHSYHISNTHIFLNFAKLFLQCGSYEVILPCSPWHSENALSLAQLHMDNASLNSDWERHEVSGYDSSCSHLDKLRSLLWLASNCFQSEVGTCVRGGTEDSADIEINVVETTTVVRSNAGSWCLEEDLYSLVCVLLYLLCIRPTRCWLISEALVKESTAYMQPPTQELGSLKPVATSSSAVRCLRQQVNSPDDYFIGVDTESDVGERQGGDLRVELSSSAGADGAAAGTGSGGMRATVDEDTAITEIVELVWKCVVHLGNAYSPQSSAASTIISGLLRLLSEAESQLEYAVRLSASGSSPVMVSTGLVGSRSQTLKQQKTVMRVWSSHIINCLITQCGTFRHWKSVGSFLVQEASLVSVLAVAQICTLLRQAEQSTVQMALTVTFNLLRYLCPVYVANKFKAITKSGGTAGAGDGSLDVGGMVGFISSVLKSPSVAAPLKTVSRAWSGSV